ncbi:FtsX-like permease family protein [Actinomadura graeca]|uniref:FtsX-like permease family protein n=1 Tax=Actinomadura graeca TaxID=2750812 RepID=A0ABX8R6J7_9ACTN|nr:FtsX-like permease family protein [Actinomadura graeca]QXJ26690.1 FtsX-like permease family protein [Actinomadura graeca]
MLRTTLAGLLAHKLRLLLTAVAITLGVGFISGTFVLTDTMDKGVARTFARSAGKVDAAILPRGDAPPGGGDSDEVGIPAGVLARVKALPGVTEVQGAVRGDAALVGKNGKTVGDFPTVGISVQAGRLLRVEVEKGRAPSGAAEAVLGTRAAERTGYGTGDAVTVLDHRGRPHRFTVVGIVDFGIDQEADAHGAVGFDAATTLAMTGARNYHEVDVLGADKAAVAAAVGASYRVYSGDELARRLAKEAGADTEIIRAGLLIFGLVAMLVSALVIYNTFSILIAQRMREMALLRCVGATRRQVFGGVLAESAVVGLVGSLLGIVAGVGLGAAAVAGIGRLTTQVPVSGLALAGRTVVIGLAVGVAVTVLSALLPARAATRVPPVAALRSELEPGGGRFRLGVVRTALTVLLALAGVALGLLGTFQMPKGTGAMYTVALAGGVFFLAVIAGMPALVRPFGRVAGAVPARLGGVPGRLAVENARRTPRRTATTTIALTVGVGLMSLFAVIAASGKATSAASLEEQYPVEFQVQARNGKAEGVTPHELTEALRGRKEFSLVFELLGKDTQVGGTKTEVGSLTGPALGTVLKPRLVDGPAAALRPGGLTPGTAVVEKGFAAQGGLKPGATVQVKTARGNAPVKIAAVFTTPAPVGEVLVPEADFRRYFGAPDESTIYVKDRDGVPADTARRVVENAARPYPTAKVFSTAEVEESIGNAIDTMLMIFGGLLGLAIVIALFGIANTLTLSVVERTRESALLRALGLTKRQLRRMLSVEALVMAVIGASTGVVLGIAFGWAATHAMSDTSVFALPYLQVAGFVALAGAAGMVAAVMPARRAAKASIVESLATD